MRRSKASRPTWRSPCIPAAAISAPPGSPQAATNSSPSICSAIPISTAISWNTTATAPAASSRCASSPRARSSWCSAWSPPRAAGWSRSDEIKRRIDEATKYVALDQLCLSPQCGFASTEEGNVLAEDEQWAKLRMIVELAEEVWGEVREAGSRVDAACTMPLRDKIAMHPRPLPRRSCRQPAAPGAAETGARPARARRDHRRATQGGRRPRDRRDHQTPGRHRPESRHRRRIPPRVLELRFSWRPRRRRGLSRRAQDQVPGPEPEADDAARHRQARHVFRPSDARAFQVRESAHARDAEDDDPVAVVAAFPLWPRRRAGDDLSRHGRLLPRPRPDLPQSRARLRRPRLPLSAARRGELHLSVRPETARAGGQPRRRSRTAAGDLCRA